jgi:hydroxyacylglutathione hydrolase
VTSGKVATTIGYERRANAALQFGDEDAFVRYMNAGQPSRPANMDAIIAINHGHRPLSMGDPIAPRLSAAEAQRRATNGQVIIDVRPTDAFSRRHAPGAVNVQVTNRRFEQRVGWVTAADAPLLLAADDAEAVHRALHKLAFVGLDARVEGWFAVTEWDAAGLPGAVIPQVDAEALRRLIEEGRVRVIDLREPSELSAGSIPSAIHLTLQELADAPGQAGPRDQPLAFVCNAGSASSTAASLLARHGFSSLANLVGGMEAWRRAGHPVFGKAGST